MSYKNPRFYKPVDYTSFNKAFTGAFDTQYKNATDYFDKKIEQRELKEKDLFAQADKMREGFGNMEELSEEVQAQLEKTVQDYVKQGLEVEGLDKPGIFGQKIKSKMYSKLDIDKGIANFNAKAKTLSGISNMILTEDLNPDEELNNGSTSYREMNALQQAMKANKSNIKFGHVAGGDGQSFDFSIEIDNPRYREGEPAKIADPNNPGKMKDNPYFSKKKTFSGTELSQLMGENTKEDREAIDADRDALVDKIVKTSETRLNENNASGNAYPGSRQNKDGSVDGAAFHQMTSAEGVVDEMIKELSSKNENNPNETNTLDDIHNNHLDFNDNINLAEFKEVKGDAATGQLDSSVITNLIKDPESADYFSMVMDLPKNEIGEQQYLLKKMGVTDDQMKGALLTVNSAKDRLVRRYLINEAEARGLESKYIEPEKAPAPSGSSGGGGNGENADETSYAQKKFNEATQALGGTEVVGIDDPLFQGPQTAQLAGSDIDYFNTMQSQKDEITSIYKNMELETKDGLRVADNVNFDPATKNVTFDYEGKRNVYMGDSEDGTKQYGDLGAQTNQFDMSDPAQFEKLYLSMGVKATGAKPGMSYEVDIIKMTDIYAKQNFFKHLMDQGVVPIKGEGLVPSGQIPINPSFPNLAGPKDVTKWQPATPGKLGKGNMSKWVSHVLKTDKGADFAFNSIAGIENDPMWKNNVSKKIIVTRNGVETTIGQWYEIRKAIRANRNN